MSRLPVEFCLFLLATTILSANGVQPTSNRAKRFAGFSPLSSIGGNLGCVVSQDKLFINGRFTKSLDEDEQEEMRDYKRSLDKFKAELKAFVEQQQSQLQLAESEAKAAALLQSKKQPEAPKRPSFCSEKATTQFVFDGCTVQGDSVFIGDSFVRKLTAEDQRELVKFEREFTAYQEAIAAGFKKQMEQFFGQRLGVGLLLGNSNNNNSTETAAAVPPPTEVQIPKEPKTPEFCTLIV